MSWMTLGCTFVIMASAGVVFTCLIRIRQVFDALAVMRSAHRDWLSSRLRLHRILIAFFLFGYFATGVAMLIGADFVGDVLIASVLLLGSLFIYVGITVQNMMMHGMMQTIKGLVPICAWCKKFRVAGVGNGAKPAWESVETFLARRTEVEFTHGMCPECARMVSAEVKKRPLKSARRFLRFMGLRPTGRPVKP